MFYTNCGFQIPKCGAESSEKMNDREPTFRRTESHGRPVKPPVIAFGAMLALSITGTLPAQGAEQPELSSGAKPTPVKVLDFAGRLAETVKKSVGSKCDQFAGDPEDPQKIGSGVSLMRLNSGTAIKACQQAVGVSPLARYQYQLGRASDKAEKYTEALDWYRKAAEQGYAPAQNALGGMYERGRGFLQQDHAEAMNWYRKAADQGDAGGQYRVGLMYRDHKGVPQNNEEGSKWFRLAAAQRHGGAKQALEELEKKEEREKEEREKEEREKWDSYETVTARVLNAYKLEYLNKKVKVELVVDEVEIQTSTSRLNVEPLSRYADNDYGVDDIDVLVDKSSSMYDWIIEEVNPFHRRRFTVWGTVHAYSNTYDSVYIHPDQISFCGLSCR